MDSVAPAQSYKLGSLQALPSSMRQYLECVLLAALYILSARLCQLLAIAPGNITPIWLPSGIIFVALLSRGYYLWPGIFIGAFVGNVWAYIDLEQVSVLLRSLASAGLNGLGDCLCAYIGANAVRKQLSNDQSDFNVRTICIFISFAAILGPLVSAVFGVGGLMAFGFIDSSESIGDFITWWTGDAAGVLLLGSVAMAWRVQDDPLLKLDLAHSDEYRWFIAVGITTLMLAVVLGSSIWGVIVPFVLILPMLAWSALRLGLRWTHTAGFVICISVILVSVLTDPETSNLPLNSRLVGLQLFIFSLVVNVLLMTAIATQWAHSYREIQISKRLAEQANAFKSTFLAAISHELRTPMNGVMGFTDLLQDTSLSNLQNRYVKGIDSSSKHMMGLVNELLDLAKVESGSFDILKTAYSPRTLIDKTYEQFSQFTSKNILTLKTAVSPDIPDCLLGDEKRLRQLLANLLSNAFKFTSEGEICLFAEKRREGSICYGVKDTGLGIVASEQETIFEPFSQANHNQSHHEGTGLGLHICKQLVASMGGEISMQSRVGEGSVFWFEVPLVEGHSAVLIPQKEATVPDFSSLNLHLLVADDNAVNIQVVTALLKKFNCSFSVAVNGQAACEMASIECFDLILMDCLMPVMDGYIAAKTISSTDNPNRDTPIIALTANALAANKKKCLAHGMCQVLTKPIDRKVLYVAIQQYAKTV
ncbi:MAG: signal transduction histidine kinase/ActR/RegA family two-component response regulator [Oceanicoccus sp.]|jgi:signal transduction histidine kinase/ActR/RegA family two-component response regulator